jgi:hypothetical protein
MTRERTTDSKLVDNLKRVAQCSLDLQNVQECDATEDDSSNADGLIITTHSKLPAALVLSYRRQTAPWHFWFRWKIKTIDSVAYLQKRSTQQY